jgi:hypothetical protein
MALDFSLSDEQKAIKQTARDILQNFAKQKEEIRQKVMKERKFPQEIWDAIGLKSSVKKMEKEGEAIPPLVEKVLSKGYASFYEKKEGSVFYFDLGAGQYQQIEEKPEIILLPSLKDRKKTVLSNAGASLIDLGDGVACLEFHSKMNTIGADTVQMMRDALKEVEEKFDGLVIGASCFHTQEVFSAWVKHIPVSFWHYLFVPGCIQSRSADACLTGEFEEFKSALENLLASSSDDISLTRALIGDNPLRMSRSSIPSLKWITFWIGTRTNSPGLFWYL